jgi:polysaccharide biosynthesis/export protein
VKIAQNPYLLITYSATAALVLSLTGSGCATNQTEALAPASYANHNLDYRIAPGDTLVVFVWDNPDLSIVNAPVRPDGKITTPLAEDIQASGKTATELGHAIEQRLSQYVRQPKVTITVTGFVGLYDQQIRVAGDGIDRAQSIPYRNRMTVMDVVIAIGGLSEFASGNRAMLVRMVDGKEKRYRVRLNDLLQKGEMAQNVDVLPGDVLIIPEASWF